MRALKMTLISQYKMEIRKPRKYPKNIDPGQKKSAPGTFFFFVECSSCMFGIGAMLSTVAKCKASTPRVTEQLFSLHII